MATYTITGYDLSDFTGTIATDNTTTPDNGIGTSTTYNGDGSSIDVIVEDDDLDLEDAYLETGNLQELAQAVTLNGTTYNVGASIELEYTLTTDDVPPITFYIIRFGTGTSNSGDNSMIITSEPLTPGQTYNFVAGDDGQSVPYETICFAQDTRIKTPNGGRLVQDLKKGQSVINIDGDACEITWINSRKITPTEMALKPRLRPVRIRKDALGDGRPKQDLIVSQQHRIYLRDWRAQTHLGTDGYLVPAKALINDTTITLEPADQGVEYFHFMCDEHQIIMSNGQPSESFLPGKQALNTLEKCGHDELLELFPELTDLNNPQARAATTCISPAEYAALHKS
ncbi:hypothetical protein GCM10008927_09310 [Amylibacter ulvae]|uniref:Hedgehog/Intein (Hint) domain-containing protein n=1 Tax=Paramylibacter ulvae TaxID=1651968 RepID=A0ABQ3CYA9_9RHOB|nr:Hint domain-containing protein [Amylibacter ulvae]GHA46242.1 hypothetical protein GCM10008927_09310 [Amylibacter ulvae]